MITIYSNSPDVALARGLKLIRSNGQAQESRDGPVYTMRCPVTTVHQCPNQRVMRSPIRDANPFFHLFESMWMLAGRNDGQFLDRYIHKFSSRFGEHDGRIHGAYGHRWRYHNGVDQIKTSVELLLEQRNSRQVVISMWDPIYDLGMEVRDRPCNTHIYLRVRPNTSYEDCLDMTVCCRSNDMIMGAYGANLVHMSVLHEYLAVAIGTQMGTYYQVSNDFHAYMRDLDRWRGVSLHDLGRGESASLYETMDARSLFTPTGVGTVIEEIEEWCRAPSSVLENNNPQLFDELLIPMSRAHDSVKLKDWSGAQEWISNVAHADWRVAAREWVERRASSGQKS